MGVLGQCRLGEGVGDVGRGRVDVAVVDRVGVPIEGDGAGVDVEAAGEDLALHEEQRPHAALGQRHADDVEVVRGLAVGRIGTELLGGFLDVRIADAVHHGQRLFQKRLAVKTGGILLDADGQEVAQRGELAEGVLVLLVAAQDDGGGVIAYEVVVHGLVHVAEPRQGVVLLHLVAGLAVMVLAHVAFQGDVVQRAQLALLHVGGGVVAVGEQLAEEVVHFLRQLLALHMGAVALHPAEAVVAQLQHVVLGAVLEIAQQRLDEVGVAGGHHGVGGEEQVVHVDVVVVHEEAQALAGVQPKRHVRMLEQVVGLFHNALIGVLVVGFRKGALGVLHQILEHVTIPDIAALLALGVVHGDVERHDGRGHIGEDGRIEVLHHVNAIGGLPQGLLLVFHDEPPKWSGTQSARSSVAAPLTLEGDGAWCN